MRAMRSQRECTLYGQESGTTWDHGRLPPTKVGSQCEPTEKSPIRSGAWVWICNMQKHVWSRCAHILKPRLKLYHLPQLQSPWGTYYGRSKYWLMMLDKYCSQLQKYDYIWLLTTGIDSILITKRYGKWTKRISTRHSLKARQPAWNAGWMWSLETASSASLCHASSLTITLLAIHLRIDGRYTPMDMWSLFRLHLNQLTSCKISTRQRGNTRHKSRETQMTTPKQRPMCMIKRRLMGDRKLITCC